MQKIVKPSVMPLLHGDVLKRSNLYRWIREFIDAQGMQPGYYMEFGVLNGECMIDAYRQLRGVTSRFVGFDSFEVLPALSPEDEHALPYTPAFHQGNYTSMNLEYVRRSILTSCRMQEDELILVKCLFSDVLPVFDKQVLKQHGVPLVVYIDCDLYSSAVEVLRFIDDLVVTGTWILFDDYWCYRGSPLHGEQKAIREWIESNTRIGLSAYENFGRWGRAFIAYEK